MSQLATGRTATLIKLAFAASAKVSAALAAFALTVLVTRNMSGEEAGLFLLGFSVLAVLSEVVRLGLDNVILRILSAHGVDSYAQEKLNRSLLWVVTSSIPVTMFSLLLSNQIANYIFNKPSFSHVLLWILPATPAMAIFFLLSFAFQSQHRVVLTTLFQRLGVSILFILGFIYLWLEQQVSITSINAAKIYSISAGIVMLCALVLWFRQRSVYFSIVSYKDSGLASAAVNLWAASIMSLAVQWIGVLIVGAMLSAENVALFSAAQRTAILISFVLMVFNMVTSPRYARYWKNKNYVSLERLAKKTSAAVSVAAFPVFLIMLLFPGHILSIFGEEYTKAKNILCILAVSQFVNVMTGSVGMLLNMTGHHKEYSKVIIWTGIVTIVFSLYLTVMYGVIGAAIATAIGVIMQNIWATILVKRLLGFWIIGYKYRDVS